MRTTRLAQDSAKSHAMSHRLFYHQDDNGKLTRNRRPLTWSNRARIAPDRSIKLIPSLADDISTIRRATRSQRPPTKPRGPSTRCLGSPGKPRPEMSLSTLSRHKSGYQIGCFHERCPRRQFQTLKSWKAINNLRGILNNSMEKETLSTVMEFKPWSHRSENHPIWHQDLCPDKVDSDVSTLQSYLWSY